MIKILAAALIGLSTTAMAEDMMKASPLTVTETIDALEAALNGAGATVFARVDHTAGAAASILIIYLLPKGGCRSSDLRI